MVMPTNSISINRMRLCLLWVNLLHIVLCPGQELPVKHEKKQWGHTAGCKGGRTVTAAAQGAKAHAGAGSCSTRHSPALLNLAFCDLLSVRSRPSLQSHRHTMVLVILVLQDFFWKEMTKENVDRFSCTKLYSFYWMRSKHFIRRRKANCAVTEKVRCLPP